MTRANIHVPKIGMRMMEGELVEWLVADGDRCKAGDPIAIIETDKVQNEIEASIDGVVHIVAEVAEVYPVGEVLGYIDDED